MSAELTASTSTPLERDARLVNARDPHHVAPGDIAIGVIIGRTSEFFDFFVYAIASVLVFPSLIFPYVDALTGTIYSFALFSLAFIARPIGTFIFMAVDRNLGRGVKLTIALFLLGGSTMAIAFLPGYAQIGTSAAVLLGIFRIMQGLALGGAWDGLPSLLSLNAPERRRGWYAMIPQLGAPLGLLVANGLFAFFLTTLSTADFLDWGWRYPFFVAFAINVVALFARLRIVATPEFQRMFESRELQPAPVGETLRTEGRTVVLGAFAPLASFAMFHIVTVFPLSWVVLFNKDRPQDFMMIEIIGSIVGVLAILASGKIADRVGRRTLLGFGQSSGIINSGFSPMRRYTGAAITSDLAWLIGAGFAPLAALLLSSNFGLLSVGVYLLSGAICTLAALGINKELAKRSA